MNKKKIISIVAVVVLIAVAFVGMSLAYFTDTTEEATNVFTMGKVDITLQEHPVDDDGKQIKGSDLQAEGEGNEYHLFPGVPVDKDPTVTVLKGSEDCYVRMKVTLDNASVFYEIYKAKYGEQADMTAAIGSVLDYFIGYDSDKWITTADGYERDATNDTITVTFNYFEMVEAPTDDAGTELDPIITGVMLPEWVTGEMAAKFEDGFSVTVVAEAIQAAGFEDADAAWTAFDAD